MNDSLTQALLNRFKKRTLAHFYILNGSSEEELGSWSKDFLLKVMYEHNHDQAQNERRFELGHPDILWLTPLEDQYKIENKDFDPLFQAMAHKPLEMPWKFIFVEKPISIGESYANKLLKTLEEPTNRCTIVFLNSGAKPLLSTVESRAIKLTLTPDSKSEELDPTPNESLADYLARWTQKFPELYESELTFNQHLPKLASELTSISRGKYQVEANLVRAFLNWGIKNIDDPQKIEQILIASKHHQHAKVFNNSINERIFSLITSLS